MRYQPVFALTALLATLLASTFSAVENAHAYTINPIDSDTTGFKDVIDEYRAFVQGEGVPFSSPELVQLDPTKLILSSDWNARVFFLDEGAGKRNQLQFSTTGPTVKTDELLFNDIACIQDCSISEADGNLHVGDWLDLGFFEAGTAFDFQLLATNFTDLLQDTYGVNPQTNPDGLQHVVAYEYKDRILLGFEDLFGPLSATGGRNEGSDRDFNDVVFVVDLPVEQEEVPESSTSFALLTIGAIAVAGSRYKNRQKSSLPKS